MVLKILFSKCWQFESQIDVCSLEPWDQALLEGGQDIWQGSETFKPPLPPVKHLLVQQESKNSVTIAGLGNVVWSSCLHSGGAREVEDTNRRFRSLQPSPEKKQKVSTIFFPILFFKDLIYWLSFKGEINAHWFSSSCSLPRSSLIVITKEDHHRQA